MRWSDEDGVFIGSIEGLCGDCDHGSDPVVVSRALKRLAEETIAQWDAASLNLPDPPSPTCLEIDPARIRIAMGISQTKFARFIGVSVRTLHEWEQHASTPSGAAKALLKVAATNPQSVRHALRSA